MFNAELLYISSSISGLKAVKILSFHKDMYHLYTIFCLIEYKTRLLENNLKDTQNAKCKMQNAQYYLPLVYKGVAKKYLFSLGK
jgi:hypothetical protein